MAQDTYSDRNTAGTSSGAAGSTKEQAKQKAEEAAAEVKHQAKNLAGQAKQQATTQLAGQKERATDQLGSITTALHETSDNLRKQDQDTIAGYVEEAAGQIDRLSHYLRDHTVTELLTEAERYARREPALFMGGAMLLGLVGARFLKSTSPEHRYSSYGSRGGGRYRPVHGTAGAEMPDPSQRRGMSTPRGASTYSAEGPGLRSIDEPAYRSSRSTGVAGETTTGENAPGTPRVSGSTPGGRNA